MIFVAELVYGEAGPAPAVRFPLLERTEVFRTWTDSLGQRVTEQVRWTPWRDTQTYVVDPEVQQGRSYVYRVGADTSAPIEVPELPHTVLVHPTVPGLSVAVDVVEDAEREYPIDAKITDIPGATPGPNMTVPAPMVVTSGGFGAARGSTTLRTYTLVDKSRLLRLVSDGMPLMWSHHIGLDLPDWLRVVALKEQRFVQICSHGTDNSSDRTQWRNWTLQWVAQDRPSPEALPVRARIRDLAAPIRSYALPIKEL